MLKILQDSCLEKCKLTNISSSLIPKTPLSLIMLYTFCIDFLMDSFLNDLIYIVGVDVSDAFF